MYKRVYTGHRDFMGISTGMNVNIYNVHTLLTILEKGYITWLLYVM